MILVEPEELPVDKPITGELNAVGFSNGRQGVLSGTVQGGLNFVKGFGWRAQGTIKPHERCVALMTAAGLKDPGAIEITIGDACETMDFKH